MFVVGDWIWEVDAEYRYTQCSDGVRAVLGYAPSEVIGKMPWDFMPDRDAEEMRRYALERAAKRQGCCEVCRDATSTPSAVTVAANTTSNAKTSTTEVTVR